MNWITTNIRFPEDIYMELKLEAARKRTSVARIIRDRVIKDKPQAQKRQLEKLMQEIDKLAKKMAKQNPGINLSDKLIEMRYEQ